MNRSEASLMVLRVKVEVLQFSSEVKQLPCVNEPSLPSIAPSASSLSCKYQPKLFGSSS